MIQFKEIMPAQMKGGTEGWTEGQKDGQTLFYSTLTGVRNKMPQERII